MGTDTFNGVLTVFNEHNGIWYPTVLKKASVYVQMSESDTQKGFVNVGAVDINIQATKEQKLFTDNGLVQYVTPKEYAKLADPQGYVTFCPEQDFIINGAYAQLTPVDDDDYDSGWYNEANSKLDGVHSIIACGWFSLIPHFEIAAK